MVLYAWRLLLRNCQYRSTCVRHLPAPANRGALRMPQFCARSRPLSTCSDVRRGRSLRIAGSQHISASRRPDGGPCPRSAMPLSLPRRHRGTRSGSPVEGFGQVADRSGLERALADPLYRESGDGNNGRRCPWPRRWDCNSIPLMAGILTSAITDAVSLCATTQNARPMLTYGRCIRAIL